MSQTLSGHKSVPFSFYRSQQDRLFKKLNSKEYRQGQTTRRRQLIELRDKGVNREVA